MGLMKFFDLDPTIYVQNDKWQRTTEKKVKYKEIMNQNDVKLSALSQINSTYNKYKYIITKRSS